jgi:Tfp pilus assembly protein PilX
MSPVRLSTRRLLAAQDGFTMIIAIGVMFVTSLLLVAAFTVANGDVQLSRTDTSQKQAYYAALAGVQQYEYLLQANPNYWQTCKGPASTVPEESQESYAVTALPANGNAACLASNPFATAIQSKGALANTFRIKSTGTSGKASRSLVATFGVQGFLDYVYYTNFETEDPGLYENNGGSSKTLAENCRGKYYSQWNGKYSCPAINFITGDHIEGPMHTNDTALVSGAATFGRKGHEPKDTVEINGGTYGSYSGCSSGAEYFTTTKCYTKGATLTPPPTDTSLDFYVESEYRYEGMTRIELKGSEMTVITYNESTGAEQKKTGVKLPPNGLIYVKQSKKGCGWTFDSENADTSSEESNAKGCGNVYVRGNYTESLTIAGENNVIVNGNVYPTSVSKLGSTPTGTAVLGLIASNYVRVYHPCSSGKNQTGSLENPWIYAAILATGHSWIVDNPACGSNLGELGVFGAIGQNYRGIVGTSGGGGGTGYYKNYEYDDRLATDEPPYFLAPLKAGWKIIRQTAPNPG